VGGRAVEGPVWVLPGHPDGSALVHVGYGRRRTGRVGQGTGFDAYPIRTSTAPWFAAGASIERTGRRYQLAATQDHHSMEGRRLVRVATLSEYQHEPSFAPHMDHAPATPGDLFPEPPIAYTGYAWGLTIDLQSCIGCQACVTACQAENNIPVVGKMQVRRGREMHWIRVDRYFEGSLDAPAVYYQPVVCMHCEKAPCETVCPVAATVHSSEGLNDMVYNRCVGTRYCSNNCPYKVRRFNFLLYSDWNTASFELMRNPDVTVRSRGVMEKCTYCVQRINAARITAEKESRRVLDGEIVPACAATCPADAIVFGDVNDPHARVAQLKRSPLNYGLLIELNTQPRTTYLAAVRNPNPVLEPAGAGGQAPAH
jgi:molybdopterin-containing oxidoreductase family iron-sulfur binding subunit